MALFAISKVVGNLAVTSLCIGEFEIETGLRFVVRISGLRCKGSLILNDFQLVPEDLDANTVFIGIICLGGGLIAY